MYAPALDRRAATHLLRRTGIGHRADAVGPLVGLTAEVAADLLVDAALAAPMPPEPAWANLLPPPSAASDADKQAFQKVNNENVAAFRRDWVSLMPAAGLRERMTLFWHDHFATEQRRYELATIGNAYVRLLRTHALGDFKTLLSEVGKTPAMLIYLNGVQNVKGKPNENYARELLELFTMGQVGPDGAANYTQQDIEQIARALTGWQYDRYTDKVSFNPGRHDTGQKTFFGRTGAYGYDDVLQIIFETRARQTAHYICRKLYQHFVHPVADERIVAGLASVLIEGRGQISYPLRLLLKSAHFYEERFSGAMLKSPIELFAGFLTETHAAVQPSVRNHAERYAALTAQQLLNPPNVAGWPGYHDWLTTTTLPVRWHGIELFLSSSDLNKHLDLIGLSRRLLETSVEAVDPALRVLEGQPEAFRLPVLLAQHFLAVPVRAVPIEKSSNDFASPAGVPAPIRTAPAYAQELSKTFLGGKPWYDWNLTNAGAPALLRSYVRFLSLLPEFQLN